MPKMTLTLFAAAVSLAAFAEIPLPEHPRPDFERAAWLNLNGTWDFRFDGERDYARKILVPFGWGSPASGVRDEGDTGWYRRTVTVPAAFSRGSHSRMTAVCAKPAAMALRSPCRCRPKR